MQVLEQEADIVRIHAASVYSTENVKSGNQLLREVQTLVSTTLGLGYFEMRHGMQAMQNRAGMRVWILFFLLVLTFTLLFLDWYNP